MFVFCVVACVCFCVVVANDLFCLCPLSMIGDLFCFCCVVFVLSLCGCFIVCLLFCVILCVCCLSLLLCAVCGVF